MKQNKHNHKSNVNTSRMGLYILLPPSLIIHRSIFCCMVNKGAGSSAIGCAINFPKVGIRDPLLPLRESIPKLSNPSSIEKKRPQNS